MSMKKNIKRLVSGIMCVVMATTCSMTTNAISVTNAEAAEVTELSKASTMSYVVGKDKLPFTDKEIYEQLFDINNIVDIDIDITNEEIKKLQKDYDNNSNSPIYRMADVKISITLPSKGTYEYMIDEVGIRLKGNMSRVSLYDESKGIYNLDHFKLKFQETFDSTDDGYVNGEYYINEDGTSKWNDADRKVRKKRTFGNLEKLDVKWNRNLDSTHIREYYAFKIFRSEGICAPHMGLSTMQMNIIDKTENSAYLGVYSIYEPVDSAFIENNVMDSSNNYILNENGDYTDGDLYKAGWAPGTEGYWVGADLTKICTYGISDDMTGYAVNYDLKTNKKKSDKSAIKNVLEGLANVSSKEDLAKYVDMKYFVRYAAVAYAVGNGDDMRNNYNNYYLYFYKDNADNGSQKMIVIPYDYDRCLGLTMDYNPLGNGMSNVDPFSANALSSSQKNPLYKYSVDKGGFYVKEYTEALKKVYENELLTTEAFEKEYNIAKKNYADKVTPSKDFENASKDKFYFTINTDNDPKQLNTTSGSASDKNMIISEYLKRMMSTLGTAIDSAENVSASECYIRGEFTGWDVKDSYKLEYNKASKLHSIKLDLSEDCQLKVYNKSTDTWYGYGAIIGDIPSSVTCEEDENANIKVKAGTYYIIFDATSSKIQISNSEIPTEVVTEKPTDATTEKPTDTTTEKPTDATTEKPTDATTEKPTDTTTEKPTDTTTVIEKVKVTFDANGGKVSKKDRYSVSVKYGTDKIQLKNASRSKYTFLGWYTKKNGGSKLKSGTKFVKDVTYYAHWKKVSVSKAVVSGLKNTASGKMSITLKKVSGADGYEIVYSTNSKFKSSKKLDVSSNVKIVSKLKKNKTYYVKARAYKRDSSNKKVYGNYSSVKKLKIKK